MADKAISELVAAERITATDLFVLEQSGTAKKLTGQILENWLVSFADGHGGIQSLEKTGSTGLVDTYRITLADETTFEFAVTNGKSIVDITKTATAGLVDTYTIAYNDGTDSSFVVANGRGIKSWAESVSGLTHTHTITYNDGTSDTFTVTDGEKGDQGDNAYTWIKYASQEPTAASHSMGDVPDNWMGIYTGTADTAPTDWSAYRWSRIKGDQGNTGDPAKLVSSATEYQASDSGTIIPSGTWTTTIPVVAQGKYLWTRVTATYNTGDPVVSYSVGRMGLDGSGSVSSVSGVSPDSNGNVPLTAENVDALPLSGGAMTGPIDMQGQALTGLNQPTGETQAASKGYVDASVRKAAPRNLLDNSDFRNPVNQRGATAYTKDSGYTIDRWFLKWSGAGTLTIEDGYINLYRASYGCYIFQNISDIDKLVGRPLTLAARVRGHGNLSFRIADEVLDSQILFTCEDWTTVCITDTITDYTGSGMVNGVQLSTSGGSSLDIQWVALYEGTYTAETLPEYQPKGYGAELAECQRYYYRFNYLGGGTNFAPIRMYHTLPAPMRLQVPTVNYAKNDGSGTVEIYIVDNSTIDITVAGGSYAMLTVDVSADL